MKTDRVKGKAKEVAGKCREDVGRATGDVRQKADSAATKQHGKIQNSCGELNEAMKKMIRQH